MVFEYQRVLVLWILIAAIKPSDVRECMGDPELDQDNPILKREQEAQVHCSFPSFFSFLFSFFSKTENALETLFYHYRKAASLMWLLGFLTSGGLKSSCYGPTIYS
jgi:hypothetical protein